MKNKLIIHGHFYQPPREDPWLGQIPHQESSFPYHDWNERITKECYAANSMSRTLNAFGQITDIINNYRYISFNFGPTLLNWLKENSPYVYEHIIEADKDSRTMNNGHGNAIAQAYNHTILPLCSNEDARTQIVWGLKDFEHHFRRRSEGMWLPETAVNLHVIDLLIEEGVNFIILSPFQVEAICPVGVNKWQPLNDNPVPSGRAYKIERPHGAINVFFFNHILATGISFQHFLRNSERLYDKLVSFKQNADPTYLVNVATDGEVYGHHEPFGDMCLAALARIVEKCDDFEFTNYAHYLEQFPPTYLVKLKEGEKGYGTSWSCAHGVSRWFRNCGCSTGGPPEWNQEWRTPLRNAFVFLRDGLKAVFIKEMSALSSKDPMELRDDYIRVLMGETDRMDFARQYLGSEKAGQPDDLHRFLRLLEGQRYAMYMFTSCGWFFSEISGLEATQNLHYAIRAIHLYAPFTDQDFLSPFLSELENARSNISSFGSGRNIVESMIIPAKKGLEHGAAIFILSELYHEPERKKETCGIFRMTGFSPDASNNDASYTDASYNSLSSNNTAGNNAAVHTAATTDRAKTGSDISRGSAPLHYRGEISVCEYTTMETAVYRFTLSDTKLEGITLILEKRKNPGGFEAPVEISASDLPLDLRTYITNTISTNVVDRCITESRKSLGITMNAISYLRQMHVPRPKTMTELAELLIDRIFEKILNNPVALPAESELRQVKELAIFAKEHTLSVDIESLKKKISAMITHQTNMLTSEVEENTTKVIVHLLETCREFGAEPELTRSQNRIFRLLQAKKEYSIDNIEKEKNFTEFNKLRRLIRLGSLLGFDVEEYKDRFFDIE